MQQLPDIIPPRSTILVLAPHPDDFDAVAVTMRRLHDVGSSISVHVLTSGASGVEDSFCPGDNEAKRRLRQQEQRAACRYFGLPDAALHFANTQEDAQSHLLDNDHNFGVIREVIASSRPAAIFLPHGNDTNPDHQTTHRLTVRAVEQVRHNCQLCLIYDPKTTDARINALTPFDEDAAEWKAGMLRLHASQHQRNLNTRGHGFDERILAVNRRLAVDSPYAEAFEVVTC